MVGLSRRRQDMTMKKVVKLNRRQLRGLIAEAFDSADTKRLKIALKSPQQRQADTRPRCEDCGRVLTADDFKAYWDDDVPFVGGGDTTPRICNACNDEAEATGR